MKVAVINGMLGNENEMKKILELVVCEFDKYEIEIINIDLKSIELESFNGIHSKKMDEIFNRILKADAVLFATSIHMNNITHIMQNFLTYLELPKYKPAVQSKNVLPVIIHNTNDELPAYFMLSYAFKTLKMLEANKIIINIPNTITDDYIDKTCKYIKNRIKEFSAILVPEKVEKNAVDNEKINEILNSNDLVYDENQLTLDLEDSKEGNIKELTGMVTDKLRAREIVSNEEENRKEKNVNEITQKYKTKIEEIMQETLFGDDESEDDEDGNETVAEKIFQNMQEEMLEKENDSFETERENKVEISNTYERSDSQNEEKITRQEDESIDSLIARVVARTKQKNEEERLENERKEEFLRKQNEDLRIKEEVINEQLVIDENALENEIINDDFNEEFVKIITHDEQVNTKINDQIDNYINLQVDNNIEDEIFENQIALDEVNMYDVNNESVYTYDNKINANQNENKTSEDLERYEPASIKELRKKLNNLREAKEEIAADVSKMQEEIQSERKVTVSKYELGDFKEPHEVIPYEEESKFKIEKDKNSNSMTLKEMTKNLIYLFKAPENENMKALVQINVEGEEGFSLYLNIMDNKCAVFDGVNMNNDLTIYVKDEKWRTILDGEVTLQRAFMTGLVKVTGNFMMLNKLDNTLLAYNKD